MNTRPLTPYKLHVVKHEPHGSFHLLLLLADGMVAYVDDTESGISSLNPSGSALVHELSFLFTANTNHC